MLRRPSGSSKLSVIRFITFALAVLTLTAISNAMVMSPHRIVLNAECVADNNQDIQAIIGYSSDGAVDVNGAISTLIIADITDKPFSTTNVRYCYIDDNFLIGFDRKAIQDTPEVRELANTGPVPVEVTVWFNAYRDAEGNIIGFADSKTATSEVEIVLPGNKK